MTIRVAINGYGRIGRNILRAHYESGKKHDIQIVAINDLGDPKTNVHLTRFDTAHGKFPGTVTVDGDYMVVNGDTIRVLEIGRASCRDRVCQYVLLSVVAVSLNQKTHRCPALRYTKITKY